MVQVFKNITKAELDKLMNDSLLKMDIVSLNNLRKSAKAAGLLTPQYENMLGIAINNRTYEEIKNSDKYTEEEKALALDARNEYNSELRAKIEDKLYNAKEIMSRAVEKDGKYHFAKLTRGEMDFLVNTGAALYEQLIIDENISKEEYNAKEIMSRAVEKDGQYHFDNLSKEEEAFLVRNGILLPKEIQDGKTFPIGQIENKDIPTPAANDKNLSEDVKKSKEFWGNFNDKKAALTCLVQALKDNAVKVEAEKDGKKVFTGIDRGNNGFDIVKENKNEETAKKVEPYSVFDLIIKKAKMSNPKAKVRIKDNVQDEETRNKILIACAKNNMEPTGNLPEGFDFEQLKQIVKEAKSIEDINALAKNLYGNAPFTIEQQQEKENKTNAAVISVARENQQPEKKDNKDNTAVVAPATNENKQENKNSVVAATIPVGNGGNQQKANANNNAATTQTQQKPVEAPKKSWWKKVKDAVVVAGITFLGFLGVRSCQNQEKLEENVKDLQEQLAQKSIDDCNELSARFADEYAKGYADGKKDCEDEKTPVAPKPKSNIRKSKPKTKTEPKQEVLVDGQNFDGLKKLDGVGIEPVATQKIPDQVENIALPEPKEEVTDTKKKTSDWVHGKYYQAYKDHGRN